jgi:hypothetical protein
LPHLQSLLHRETRMGDVLTWPRCRAPFGIWNLDRRKKWERCWDEVTTCSKACNGKRKQAKQEGKKAAAGSDVDDETN